MAICPNIKTEHNKRIMSIKNVALLCYAVVVVTHNNSEGYLHPYIMEMDFIPCESKHYMLFESVRDHKKRTKGNLRPFIPHIVQKHLHFRRLKLYKQVRDKPL